MPSGPVRRLGAVEAVQPSAQSAPHVIYRSTAVIPQIRPALDLLPLFHGFPAAADRQIHQEFQSRIER